MAICGSCQKDMSDKETVSCKLVTVNFPDGSKQNPVAYYGELASRCPDCNVAAGGWHHPGCDREHCPKCGEQLISCGCLDVEEDPIEMDAKSEGRDD